MKKTFQKAFWAGVLLIFAFGLMFYYSRTKPDADIGHFQAERIIDGDTLVVVIYDIRFKVRLVGIDAPEMSKRKGAEGQPYCGEAKDFLEKAVLNKRVNIEGYGTDRYGRQLAEVFADKTNVNLELVKAGLAEVYNGRLPTGFEIEPYRQAEAAARKAGKGMWSLGDKYVPPKVWRENNK